MHARLVDGNQKMLGSGIGFSEVYRQNFPISPQFGVLPGCSWHKSEHRFCKVSTRFGSPAEAKNGDRDRHRPFPGLDRFLPAIIYFGETDFREWKQETPEGTRQQYACEVVSLTAEAIEEVLKELPEYIRTTPERVRNLLPDCAFGIGAGRA